jgi:hypothetical protein
MFETRTGGIAGIYLDEHVVVDAARKIREAGFTKFDAISPFPLHGLKKPSVLNDPEFRISLLVLVLPDCFLHFG